MTVNRVVVALSVLWLVLIGMSFLHPAMPTAGTDEFHAHLDRLVRFFAWQGAAMAPALAVLILRVVLQDRVTGMSRWLAWVPPAGTLVLIVALVAFGQLAG